MFKLLLKCIIFIGFFFLLAGIITAENNQSSGKKQGKNEKSVKDNSHKSAQEGENNGPELGEHYVNMPNWKEAGNSDFVPKELTVRVGEVVSWTNNDLRTHYVTTMKHNYPDQNLTGEIADEEEEAEEEAEDETFFSSSDINPGETFSYSFKKPGVYKYFCFTHPIEMQGVVIVKE